MEAIQTGDQDQFPTQDESETDLELKLARYEWLMDRRPLLLNSVLLRQNPHNVNEWHKRVDLLKGHPEVIEINYYNARFVNNNVRATKQPIISPLQQDLLSAR